MFCDNYFDLRRYLTEKGLEFICLYTQTKMDLQKSPFYKPFLSVQYIKLPQTISQNST